MPSRCAGVSGSTLRVCVSALLASSLISVDAQESGPAPAGQPLFRASATLVTVDAVVTDEDGRHVKDLTAADFEIVEDGTRRQVRQAVYVPLVSTYAARAGAPLPDGNAGSGYGGSPSTAASRVVPLSRAVETRPERISRTIAVVVDDLGLSFESTVNVRNALRRFVDEQVQPGDLVAILRTSGGIGALQQFTTDKRLLNAAVDRVQWTVLSRSGIAAFTPIVPEDYGLGPRDQTRQVRDRGIGGQIAEVGAAYGEDSLEALRGNALATGTLGALEFVVRGVQSLPGRKAVVFISEGFDLFNRKGQASVFGAFTRLMDRANRAGVVVYAMDGRGLETGGFTADDNPRPPVTMGPGGGPTQDQLMRDIVLGARHQREVIIRNTEEALHYLAWQTGGFAVLNSNDLAGGLARVLDDLQGYYLIGFDAPEDTSRDWVPGRVVVRVKRPGLRVRSRQGFFGPADPSETPEPVGDALTLAALSPFNAGDITVRLTSLFGHDREAGPYVRSLLFIDANELQFAPAPDGRHEAHLEVLQMAVGDNGVLLGDWRRTLTFSFTEDQVNDARARGIVYSTRMALEEPGAYQVRVAVRDTATAKLGSASRFLQVPRVGEGRLAVSGVLVRAYTAGTTAMRTAAAELQGPLPGDVVTEVLGEPSVRIFAPGSDVIYAYEIYDGLDGRAAGELEMSTRLLRNGRALYESAPAPVKAGPRSGDVRVIPIAGRLSLGLDVPPGRYTLEVDVTAGSKRRASQWIDFEVRR